MNFADLKNRHAGCDVWVCGTGPSLDTALKSSVFSQAQHDGDPVICINLAIEIVPSTGCRYFIANDNETWKAMGGAPHQRNCISIVNKGYAGIWDREAPNLANDVRARICDDIIECAFASPGQLPTNRDDVARDEMLYSCQGSATPAVFLAWYMGADWIHLLGMTGGPGKALAAAPMYSEKDLQDRRGTDYGLLLSSCTRVAKLLQGDRWTLHE